MNVNMDVNTNVGMRHVKTVTHNLSNQGREEQNDRKRPREEQYIMRCYLEEGATKSDTNSVNTDALVAPPVAKPSRIFKRVTWAI